MFLRHKNLLVDQEVEAINTLQNDIISNHPRCISVNCATIIASELVVICLQSKRYKWPEIYTQVTTVGFKFHKFLIGIVTKAYATKMLKKGCKVIVSSGNPDFSQRFRPVSAKRSLVSKC